MPGHLMLLEFKILGPGPSMTNVLFIKLVGYKRKFSVSDGLLG